MSRLPVFQHPPPIACLVAVLATLATPGTARAADSEPDAPETSGVTAGQPGRQSAPDFLFGRPRSVVGVAWGWLVASQSGGIFDFTRDLLTVDEGDFDTGMFRLEAGLSIGPRLDVLAEVGFSGSAIASEYRDEVETVVDTAVEVFAGSVAAAAAVRVVTATDLPIVQTTELMQSLVGGSLRFWLIPRGREVGRFAWVPNRFAPYVGAGGGAQWYRFTQFGDFVDFIDYSIFSDRLESSGWTASGHVFAGTSVNLTRKLFVGIEARYVWADTPLSQDFVGFDNIDLNGFQVTAGIEFVF